MQLNVSCNSNLCDDGVSDIGNIRSSLTNRSDG